MRSTLCCLLAAAGAGVVAGTSAKAAATGIRRDHYESTGPSQFDGLADTLKSGGLSGLLSALSGLAATHQTRETPFNIIKDENGNEMYDFAHPKTASTTPAPPATTMPLLVAAPTTVHQPAAPRPPPPSAPLAPNPQVVPAKRTASKFMAPAAPAAAAAPALPVASPVPTAVAAPVAPAAPQVAAQAAPMAPAAMGAPTASVGAGGGALATLAARLDALRQQVDALSAQADAAVGGAPLPLDAGRAAAPPPPVAAPQVSPQLQSELQGVLQRVKALEDENKKLHEQVNSQSAAITKMGNTEKATELQLSQVKLATDNITALIHKKHHKKAKAL